MSIREIRNPQQLQNAINSILDYIAKYPQGQSWDFKGNRITNAGPSVNANDYVTRGEIPTLVAPLITSNATNQSQGFYTAVFNPPDGTPDGTNSPAYVVGLGRSGVPNQAWLGCTGAPNANNLTANILYQGNPILQTNLEILEGNTTTVITSTFVIPVPTLAQLSSLQMQLVTGGGATGISMGLVVRVIAQQ